ncbi:hypothetical protein KM043_011573 [Ampulex compressa]|nr:hypothetical protein KM043_011573 [Ampulex compressa]
MHQVPYRVELASKAGRNERLRVQTECHKRRCRDPRCGGKSAAGRAVDLFKGTHRKHHPRSHVAPSRVIARYTSTFAPSNLLLIGLALCCLAIQPVQPRQNHHQTCPGCPHQQQQHRHVHEAHRSGASKNTAAPSPDDLRLEAIKHQILTKLGLRSRPDVNRTLATVPRHLALETLYRAEAQTPPRYPDRMGRNGHEGDYSGEFLYGSEDYTYGNFDRRTETTTEGSGRIAAETYQGYRQEQQEEMDDFYARTSEIITFAEPGEFILRAPCLLNPRAAAQRPPHVSRHALESLWTKDPLLCRGLRT